jgi:hypothetical protein
MRRALPVLFLLAFCAAASAQDAQLAVKGGGVKSVTVVESLPFTVSAPPGALLYFWSVPAGVKFTDSGESIAVTECPNGDVAFGVKTVTVDFDKKTAKTVTGSLTVRVGTLPPKPPPDPAPIPAAGLSVLIIEETAARSTLPREQLLTMTATGAGSVRDYLVTHCVKGPNGWPEWRILDKDTDMSNESKFWQDAMKLPRGAELPWLMVTNGKAGYSGPLPKTQAETLKILKQYGE